MTNPFRELAQALADTERLQRRYYLLTTAVGVAGVFVGIGLLLAAGTALCTALPVDPGGPIGQAAVLLLWLGVLLVAIPFAVYAGAVCVAGLLSLSMVCAGRMSSAEAVRYTFLSRYPESWFRVE